MSEPRPAHSPDEVPHSRGRGGSRSSLLVPGLAIGGLLLIPAIGLVYASTTSFGKGADEASSAAPVSDDDEDGVKPASPSKKSTPKKTSPTSSAPAKPAKVPRSDEAAECCKALSDLAKDAPIEQRAAYLSASQSCEAATTPTVAKKRVKNQLRLAKIDPPPSCED
jgi:hypothetical protein